MQKFFLEKKQIDV